MKAERKDPQARKLTGPFHVQTAAETADPKRMFMNGITSL